jgi:hypothetical protein
VAGGSSTTFNAFIPTNGVSYLVGNKINLSSVTGFTPTDHNTLTGRTDADSHPASAITYTPSTNLASTEVQAALTTLADRTTKYSAALSWTGAGPYTMAITAATHGKGLNVLVQVRETVADVSYDVALDSIAVDDATGDVTLTSSENITGKVVIL